MDPIAFAPVPLRTRRDGWTPERQCAFIAALAATGRVAAACRTVGLTRRAAYVLRDRPDAGAFRAAWDAALVRPPVAVGRAIDGIATPVTRRGRQVGERRRFDDRLAMALLRRRWPERFGRHLDPAPSGWDLFVAAVLARHGAAEPPSSPAPGRDDRILPASPIPRARPGT